MAKEERTLCDAMSAEIDEKVRGLQAKAEEAAAVAREMRRTDSSPRLKVVRAAQPEDPTVPMRALR